MKKLILIFTGLLSLIFPAQVSAQGNVRKLTVMVYMCGSNLESTYGSASADIQEMLDAGINSKDVSLLVMTGGSENWSMGFDASQVIIHEIGSRGRRIVRTSEQMSMGNADTLTELLLLGKNKYPAEKYALILWDHGGGPLEGVCWDELYSLDNLTLTEITSALSLAKLGQKLSWIGFDACLMSSLEVAAALSPYAEYMIASQETEPTFGWNYSFLKGIENDSDGAAAGRRIVDAYFEGQDEYRDILTLACTDLTKAAEAVGLLDAFFAPLADTVSRDVFPDLSNVRIASTAFGRGFSGTDDDGYDLVDALDLITKLDDGSGSELIGKLNEAIVYSRSNEEGANGLTLYHPLTNKIKYLEKWRDGYTALRFSGGYSNYLKAFGTLLTGAELVNWNGLTTQDMGRDEQGNYQFSLQLTPEQAAVFSSAQLLLFTQADYGWSDDIAYDMEKIDSWELLCSVETEYDAENRIITGTYTGQTLYVLDGRGGMKGPIFFTLTDDGNYNAVMASYYPLNSDINDLRPVLFYLDGKDAGTNPEIARVRVKDPVTGSYTKRITISEEDYSQLLFVNFSRIFPTVGENEPIPPFKDWEINGQLISWPVLTLPADWSFYFTDSPYTGFPIYAAFLVNDSQQNEYCSMPIPVSNPNVSELTVITGSVVTDDYSLELSGYLNSSEGDPGLQLIFTLTNLTDDAQRFRSDGIVLNEKRIVDDIILFYPLEARDLAAHESNTYTIFIPAQQLIDLGPINTVSMSLQRNYEDAGTAAFRIADICLEAAMQAEKPLAETEKDGLTVRLLSIEPENAGFSGILYVDNQRDADYRFNGYAVTNGIQTVTSAYDTVPAGMSKLVEFWFSNSNSISMELPYEFFSEDEWFSQAVLSDLVLQRHGFESISDISLVTFDDYYEEAAEIIPLRFSQPWSIDWNAPIDNFGIVIHSFPGYGEGVSAETPCLTLIDNAQLTVNAERAVLTEKGIVLGLELINRTGMPIALDLEDAVINGEPVGTEIGGKASFMQTNDFWVMPESAFVTAVVFEFDESHEKGAVIRDFGFTLLDGSGEVRCPVTVSFPDEYQPEAGAEIWVDAEEMICK